MNTMKRAWEIRREVAKEMNVKVSKVSMSECLKMAWEEAKTPKKLTLIQALTNYSNKNGFEIVQVLDDCHKAGLKVNVVIKNVKYYDYKNDNKYRGYSTINGTYNAKSKTIDLINKNIVIINCLRTVKNDVTGNNKNHNIIVENVKQIYNALNKCTSDFDVFFNGFDWKSNNAFEMFKNA